MNIAQGLKKAARLSKDCDEIVNKIHKYNVYREDDTTNRPNTRDLLDQYIKLCTELGEVKSKIAVASAPIADKLADLAVAQKKLASLQIIPTTTEPYPQMVGNTFTSVSRIAQLDQETMRKMVDEVKEDMRRLQDEIDDFNASVQI